MPNQVISLARLEADKLIEVMIASGTTYSDPAINLAPYAYGGFVLPGTVDAYALSFATQLNKEDPLGDGDLYQLDGTKYEVTQVANGSYALPGALFGHPYFRFRIATAAAGDRVILVTLGN